MGATHVTEQVRRRLTALLSDDRPESERLLTRIRELRALEDVAACACVVQLLANLKLPEAEAEALLVAILEHRDAMRELLTRDPGLRVAAVD
jgi:hypothetical protein